MTNTPPPNHRQEALLAWLASLDASLGLDLASMQPASSDASFRRYWRLHGKQGTWIVMDAPPPHENCVPFVDVTQRLAQAGVTVPAIGAHELTQGFLLLSDLGTDTYFDRIGQGLTDTVLQRLYQDALNALTRLQMANPSGLALLDGPRLKQELSLFEEWFVHRHLGVTLNDSEKSQLAQIYGHLTDCMAQEPRVLVHRDFHCPNLIVCENASVGPNPGVLDYQDALLGPLSYDIASLVFDARTTWEEPQQLDWAIRYWEKARDAKLPVPTDFAVMHQQYEWSSLQRNLRILGVFARLNHRDHKPGYLNHMPRVMQYVRQVAGRYRPFSPLMKLLDRLAGISPETRLTF
jgi:N-acetylmuramate 1-kinase